LRNAALIEYIGEVVRPTTANARERRVYDSLVGAGTYMFALDENRVVDATKAGSVAHLINHSCQVGVSPTPSPTPTG
jgi:SET domain-containing protein